MCFDVASIITIWACNLLNPTRFVLAIPNTLLTFSYSEYSSHFLFHASVSLHANQLRNGI